MYTRTARWLLLLLLVSTISLAAQQSPYLGAIAIPGTVQVENYDLGGEGVAWHDTSAGNAFGVYRSHDMDVGAITAGGFHIGALEAGEWAEYTVDVATTGTYTVTVRWASQYTGSTTFRLLLNGVDVSGVQTVTSTGNWQTFTTKTFNASLTAGSGKILRLEFLTGFWNPDYLQFTAPPACTAPAITANPVSFVGDATGSATFSVTATGSPAPTYQWLKNGVAITGNTSATTRSLTVSDLELWRDAATYSVRVTNSCGTVTSTGAALRVRCGNATKPGLIQENISRALRFPGQNRDTCEWWSHVSMGFGTDPGFAGSYNIPVVAAAVAFIKEPVRAGVWDMNQFWTNYLSGEVGDRGTAWFYGGKEFGSYNYHAYNMTAVLAVHYWANQTNNTTVRTLAQRWIRATVAMYALAGMPQQPLSLHAKGQTDFPAQTFTGPYVAMAGDRSSWGFWMDRDRNIFLARAIGLATNLQGETTSQANVRTFVEGWSGVYGLTATEKTTLANTVNTGAAIPNVVATYLGANLRTLSRYHFVGWPRVKATLMEESHNNNTSPTFGVAYFLDPKFGTQGREAHFLWPYQGLWDPNSSAFKNNICNGTAFLDLTNRLMQATHPDCRDSAGTIRHPSEIVTIDNLPLASTRNYWVILRPDGVPLVQ